MNTKSRLKNFNQKHKDDLQDHVEDLEEWQEEVLSYVSDTYKGKFKDNYLIKILDQNNWDEDKTLDFLDQKYDEIIDQEIKQGKFDNPSTKVDSTNNVGNKGQVQPNINMSKKQSSTSSSNAGNNNNDQNKKKSQPEDKNKETNQAEQQQYQIQKNSVRKFSLEQEVRTEVIKVIHDQKNWNQPYPVINYKELTENKTSELQNYINMVIVGHVDSGKSTLIGHLLHLMKVIDNQTMHKLSKEAKEINKESFKFAWAMDSSESERKRGITMDVGYQRITTKSKDITLLDCPGHSDFVPKMISGASQADYAIIVLDSVMGSFEAGFGKGGQTKEHAFIVKSLGVQQLIVAVNKMDYQDWNQFRFNEIKEIFQDYLVNKIGFQPEQIQFIPISAFQGLNLSQSLNLKQAAWWTGKNLMQLIEDLPLPKRDGQKPVRFSIHNFYHQDNEKGLFLSGKIEGGVIDQKDKLVILPHEIVIGIKKIVHQHNKVNQAYVGQHCELQVILKDPNDEQKIRPGNVISDIQYPVPCSNTISVEFRVYEIDVPLLKGSKIVVYIAGQQQQAVISKIDKLIDNKTGQIIKRNPKLLFGEQCAEIELTFEQKICVETFSNYKTYGRIIARRGNETVGLGVILSIK